MTPPVTPAKPFDILDYKIELAIGAIALILTVVIVAGIRSPLLIVIDLIAVIALLARILWA